MGETPSENIAQLRADAQKLRKERKWPEAAAAFEKAIAFAERSLRVLRLRDPGNREGVCALLAELSQTLGSLGGTWRDAKDFEQAKTAYDQGYEVERKRREECGHLDSYNLLQRLIVRILARPEDMESEDPVVNGDPLSKALEHAGDEIASQLKAGRQDSWALADLALATILAGSSPEDALAALGERQVDRSFYESTYAAVIALLAEGVGGETPVRERLVGFQEFLERKGGLRRSG